MFKDLIIKVRRYPFINNVSKLLRRSRSRGIKVNKKGKVMKSNSRTIPFSKIQIPRFNILPSLNELIFKNKIFSILFLVSIILVILLFHLYSYFSINLEKFALDNSESREMIIDGSYSVAFLGIKTEEIAGEKYYYVNLASIIGINPDYNFFYTINPNFSLSSSSKSIRTSLNEIEEGGTGFGNLIETLERIIGVDIDRYFIIDTDLFPKYFKGFSLDTKGIIDKSKISNKDNTLNSYIFDSKDIGKDYVTRLQNEFTVQFFKGKFSTLKLYSYLLDAERLEDSIYTNFSRNEFFRFLTKVNEGSTTNGFLSESLGYKVSEDVNSNLTPNYLLLDQQIRELNKNIFVIAEQAELEIYNATDVGGLATYKTRVLSNKGANVVKFGNYSEDINENIIYINEEEDLTRFKNTINLVRNVLDGDVIIEVGTYRLNKTGDIVLVLGK